MFQLHGFCDASEVAYAGVFYTQYLLMVYSDNAVHTHTSLVIANTRVAPTKRLTVHRLELCGAVFSAKLLQHVARILEFPLDVTFAWMESLVVLGWLQGNPRTSKPLLGIESLPSWNSFHLTAGIMSVVRTIQLTVPLERYSPPNYYNINCGGWVLNGCKS